LFELIFCFRHIDHFFSHVPHEIKSRPLFFSLGITSACADAFAIFFICHFHFIHTECPAYFYFFLRLLIILTSAVSRVALETDTEIYNTQT